MNEHLQEIYDSVLNGDMDETAGFVEAALNANLAPGIILNEGMIGGAPITETSAHDIGADGYAADASRAATLAKTLVR